MLTNHPNHQGKTSKVIKKTKTTDFKIIGIGASAGGLESIENFFAEVPVDSGCAFVIIQHLSSDTKSFMPEILSRKIEMKVHSAKHGLKIEPNNVYLLPPSKNLTLSKRKIILCDIIKTKVPNKPIDLFFNSLAEEIGTESAGIVLSGTGSDGSIGIKAIHEKGGAVYVESLDSAKFDGMPSAAISTNIVDFVGTPSEIVKNILSSRKTINIHKSEDLDFLDFNDPSIDSILLAIKNKFEVDFSKYKVTTVSRRIQKRMEALELISTRDYSEYIKANPDEVEILYNEMLINVTQFFRDKAAYKILEEEVIPDILAQKKQDEDVRVWVPGCSTGEEVYSIAILFFEWMRENRKHFNLKFFATDVSYEVLKSASLGVFKKKSIDTMKPSLRSRYFVKDSKGHRVSSILRKAVLFSRHNVVSDPPLAKMDLISCRNLLIYFSSEIQISALSSIFFSLKPQSYLFLGPSETLNKFESGFKAINQKWKIYKKVKKSVLFPEIRNSGMAINYADRAKKKLSNQHMLLARQTKNPVAEFALEALLQEYVPSSILVEESLNVLHTFGNAGDLLKQKPGPVGINVRNMLDAKLSAAIVISIQRAKKENEIIEYKRVPNESNEASEYNLKVKPLKSDANDPLLFLVSIIQKDIEMKTSEKSTEINTESDSLHQVLYLEQELEGTKDSLQSTIEELETTNEELQSTNEEMISSNEELQSTNEELHSVNEELQTVNSEYQNKIEQLTQLTQDEENFLSSTQIGIIILDENLKIRKFTSMASREFNIMPQDINRPIEHFSSHFEDFDIREIAYKVMKSKSSVERNLKSELGSHYIVRFLPYLDEHDKSKGLVLTLNDVSELKNSELQLNEKAQLLEKQRRGAFNLAQDLRNAKERAEIAEKKVENELLNSKKLLNVMSEINTDGWWDWNASSPEDEYLSPGLKSLLGYKDSEVPNKKYWREQNMFPEDQKASLIAHEEHVKNGKSYHLPIRYKHKDGSTVWVICRGHAFFDDKGKAYRVVGTHTDITEIKRLQLELERSNDELERFAYIVSHDLKAPLRGINDLVGFLEEDMDTVTVKDPKVNFEGIKKNFKRLNRQVRRMEGLIRGILEYSQIGRTQSSLKRKSVKASIKEICEEFTVNYEQKIEIDTDLPIFSTDHVKLKQVFANLISNAIKYHDDKDNLKILISHEVQDNFFVFSVKDNGPGIDPIFHAKIFQIFQTLQSRDDIESTGVGLSLAKKIVEFYKGEIKVKSDVHKGSEFIFSWPMKIKKIKKSVQGK